MKLSRPPHTPIKNLPNASLKSWFSHTRLMSPSMRVSFTWLVALSYQPDTVQVFVSPWMRLSLNLVFISHPVVVPKYPSNQQHPGDIEREP